MNSGATWLNLSNPDRNLSNPDSTGCRVSTTLIPGSFDPVLVLRTSEDIRVARSP